MRLQGNMTVGVTLLHSRSVHAVLTCREQCSVQHCVLVPVAVHCTDALRQIGVLLMAPDVCRGDSSIGPMQAAWR